MEKATEIVVNQTDLHFKELDRIQRFNNRYGIEPSAQYVRLAQTMRALEDSLPPISEPSSLDELYIAEAKRRLASEVTSIERYSAGGRYDFDSVLQFYNIPREDIDALKPWLQAHKPKVLDAIERLFQTRDVEEFTFPVLADIPQYRRQAEEVALSYVQNYHTAIGPHLQNLTRAGNFLTQIKALTTWDSRSYFAPKLNTLALSIGNILFSDEDGNIHPRHRALIRLYGHEAMGHALNQVITQNSNLPYFLKRNHPSTESTAESIAHFFERRLIKDLSDSPRTLKRLRIEGSFSNICQDAEDTELLEEFNKKFSQYAVTVIADRSLGHPEDPQTLTRKVERISEVSLDKTRANNWVHSNRYNYDTDGNLNPSLVSELRYCANPVGRALDHFKRLGLDYGKDRGLIDMALLTGEWTPVGFVDNARLIAEGKISL